MGVRLEFEDSHVVGVSQRVYPMVSLLDFV